MAEWKLGSGAPRDGTEFLAAWKTESSPRMLRRAWVDSSGFACPAPDFWMPIIVPAVVKPPPPKGLKS